MDITYRPAKFEDLEDAERVVQEAGNELRVRHGRRPWPAPPPIAFPKFCLAEDPDGLWVAEHGDTIPNTSRARRSRHPGVDHPRIQHRFDGPLSEQRPLSARAALPHDRTGAGCRAEPCGRRV